MSRLQFLAALSLGCALFFSGCTTPQAPPSPSGTSALEPPNPVTSPTSPSDFGSSSEGGSSSDTETGTPAIAAALTIDLTGPAPMASDLQGVEVTGSLVTGGKIIALLEPGQALSLSLVGRGNVTTRAQLDDSIPILVSDQFEVGLGPPHAVNGSGGNEPVAWKISQDGSELLYLLTLPADSLPATVMIPVGTDAAVAAVWTSAEGGKSLQVSPSEWCRTGGMTVVEFGWQSVVALAPDGNSDSMRNQFQCHAIGAPTKAYWNLEPWRPDVGLLKFMATRCNP